MGRCRAQASIMIAALAASACSLFTDLGGNTGGEDPADAATLVDAGSGDAALASGVLSQDSFDTSCASWSPYNATVELVTDTSAGAGACKVCLTTTKVIGGIVREYKGVGPGTYFVSARVKNVSSDDWRITIKRTLDGGAVPHYANASFKASDWQTIGTSIAGEDMTEVRLWFGDTYDVGDCALVDEVTVRVEK